MQVIYINIYGKRRLIDMDQSKTRMLAEAGVAIAIAQVLSFITIFHMPQGSIYNTRRRYRKYD